MAASLANQVITASAQVIHMQLDPYAALAPIALGAKAHPAIARLGLIAPCKASQQAPLARRAPGATTVTAWRRQCRKYALPTISAPQEHQTTPVSLVPRGPTARRWDCIHLINATTAPLATTAMLAPPQPLASVAPTTPTPVGRPLPAASNATPVTHVPAPACPRWL